MPVCFARTMPPAFGFRLIRPWFCDQSAMNRRSIARTNENCGQLTEQTQCLACSCAVFLVGIGRCFAEVFVWVNANALYLLR